MSRVVASVLAWVLLWAPAAAGAQSGSEQAQPRLGQEESVSTDGPSEVATGETDSVVAEAQAIYERGVAAATDERWSDALADFERANALHADPHLRVNVATAQAHLGQLVAARASYEQALSEIAADDVQLRQLTAGGIRELTRRIPEVHLEITGLEASDIVLLDETVITDLARPHALDPGDHNLEVERRQETFARLGFDLAEGEHRNVTLTVEPVVTAVAPVMLDETTGGEFYESAWFWASVGGLVAIAVATVVIVLVASDDQMPPTTTPPSTPFEPFSGTLNPGTLRLP